MCLWYALDMLHTVGGYLLFGKSTHWFLPHVLHQTMAGVITHFVPPADLRMAWTAVFGFRGTVVVNDSDIREPVGIPGIIVGSFILALCTPIWATHHCITKLLKPTL